MAMALAPAAGLLSLTPAGRSVFFAGNRSLPWQLAPADARQLLTDFAGSPGLRGGELGVDVRHAHPPAHHHRAHPVPAGHRDPLMAQQISRYLALIPGAQLTWLPGLNHVPISDDPENGRPPHADLPAAARHDPHRDPMNTVKNVTTVTDAVAVTAAAVIGVGVLIALSSWELL